MAINESVRILQQVDLEITNEIVKICTKHNIEYFITSGTMLGAIRHRGFIPWDDDIDIGMMRDQYEKFLSVAEKELPQNLKLVTFMNSPEYHYYISRVVDTDTLIEEERMADGEKETHVSVDVYAIDGSPNSVILRKIYYFKVMYHRALMSLCYKNSIDRKRKRGFLEKILLYIMERIPVEKMTTPYKQKCKIDKLLKSNDVYKSKYIGDLMGAYRTKEMMPAEYFGKGAMYTFENTVFRGPEKYHEYLTHMYGDYMELPPEPSRRNHYKVIEIHGKKFDGGKLK